jgi:hypothetical protein
MRSGRILLIDRRDVLAKSRAVTSSSLVPVVPNLIEEARKIGRHASARPIGLTRLETALPFS